MRLSPKVARDWYVDALIREGCDVEYWDVASLIYGDDGRASQGTAYLRTIESFAALEGRLADQVNRDAAYMMLANYDGTTAQLFRIMSRHNARMYFISWGAMPIGRRSRATRGLATPMKTLGNVRHRIRALMYRRVGWVKPFEVVFAAGSVLAMSQTHARRVVPINLVDYDHAERLKENTDRLVEGRYAVFLDIYLPHQSDLHVVGLRAIDPGEYYKSLNSFFDRIEAELGLPVVIAAHPKANYGASQFNGRAILLGRTPELVRDAELVISHHSTSISYAVIFSKPILFIYTSAMNAAYPQTIVAFLFELGEYLSAPVIEIDSRDVIAIREPVRIGSVDTERYARFKYDYLTSAQSEQESTERIVLREILRMRRSEG